MNWRLSRRAKPLYIWQQEAKEDLLSSYNTNVEKMYALEKQLKTASDKLKRYVFSQDSTERTVLWYTNEKGVHTRVKLSALQEHKEKVLRPTSRAFQAQLEKVRDLHFESRNVGLSVPRDVFNFLDKWGKIPRKKSK